MRAFSRLFVILMVAVLMAGMFALPASAKVTNVKNQRDGSVRIEWDSNDDTSILITAKMSDSFDSDQDTYGSRRFSIDDDKLFSVMYWMAPGQSYWVYTYNTGSGYTKPYSYEPGKAARFSEFKKQPSFNEFVLMSQDMNGKTSKNSYFSTGTLENRLDEISVGVRLKYSWPQLRKVRTYFAQAVITSPDGDKYVFSAFNQRLPASRAYAYNNYLALDDYFISYKKMRGYIPPGKYIFTIFWDGKQVCSETIIVR